MPSASGTYFFICSCSFFDGNYENAEACPAARLRFVCTFIRGSPESKLPFLYKDRLFFASHT
ncbi:hypothetical protein CAY53_10365 [Desulfobulbus oralis]|uniref:Uncharacterized protein n=1 Tax=Desulfobulbus oralis TaxID=1986146 RepID=A0A2L1GQ97_9BACT|nr:hypothetical protein CAY53_10365 [Desulfobulbus oralis]